MSSGSVDREEGPPRKRIRKGTKSCWECKRRKVRCQLSSEDVPVCSGCLVRGSTCLSQEYPEERDNSAGGNQIGERLGRVEHLLEAIVAKMSAFEEEEASQKILTPESSNNDILTPFPTNVSSKTGAHNDNHAAPFLSLFDNTVLGLDNTPQSIDTPASPAGTKTPSCVVPKKERIRRALIELLPSQKDTDLIFASNNAWLLCHTLTFENDSNTIQSIFGLESVKESGAVKIARTLLYLVIMLQQLDSDFDARQLSMYPSVDARMERYIATVQSLVVSDDESMASMLGLECLVLMGLYQMNAGNPRRSWLVFRRCINIGQLLGIDRKGGPDIIGRKEIWFQIVQLERYLCLLLGLPAGCADPELDIEDRLDNPDVSKDTVFRWKLCAISTRIIERNQASASPAYATTQNIDDQLDSLAKDVGPEWWKIPNVIPNDRSKESASAFDRLMSQIWFFQLESLLHLPFMLRAATERRFEYSKFSCFKASREVMYRYLRLRTTDNKAFCCNVVDFGALTSAVTLFLGLLEAENGDAQEKQRRETDRALIQMVVTAMEELATDRKDVVATQSVNVIKALLAFNSTTGLAPGGTFKLTIPYFGTITIARSQSQALTPQASNATTPLFMTNSNNNGVHQQALSIDHQLPTGHWPGFTFTPSFPVQQQPANVAMSAFNPAGPYGPLEGVPGMDEWGLGEADTLFFDSLLSTDIERNWVL